MRVLPSEFLSPGYQQGFYKIVQCFIVANFAYERFGVIFGILERTPQVSLATCDISPSQMLATPKAMTCPLKPKP